MLKCCGWFFALLKALEHSCRMLKAQLNFCKAQDIVDCTKVSITSARSFARFDSVWSGILSATEANDVIDDPDFSRPQKVPDSR